jgi:AraC-like DNA-binding protein
MNTQFRISAARVRKIEELGVRLADVLRQAGLPAGFLEGEKILASTAELFAFYRGLAEASRDPAIGLKLGAEHRIERYDPLGIAAVTARSFRDALERLARYKQLTCPEALDVVDRGNESRVEFRYLLAQETEPPLLVDVAFARVVDIARQGTGGRVNPKRLELRGATGSRKMYEAHFGCSAKFGARHNTIVYAATDLDRPFLTHNPDLWAVIAPQLEAELSQALASNAIGEQVKGMLKQLMPRGRPGIEDVARELRLSSRTLQRRLGEAGATFQQLMQEARRELARHYLLNSSMELNEAAYLLGYEDAHSFFRAFNQWEGSPPGQWRELNARFRSVAPTDLDSDSAQELPAY